jgi:hypothetical protein
MARRTKRFVGLAIISVLVISAVLARTESDAERTLRKIKVGMTENEVNAILADWGRTRYFPRGEPPDSSISRIQTNVGILV